MTNLSRILKQILSRNKWVDRDTTYTFTQIVFNDGVYEFYINATQSDDVTFLALNIYGFGEKLILAAFDILDIENTGYDLPLIGAVVNKDNNDVISYKVDATDFSLVINPVIKSIDFNFNVNFDSEKYGISKNDAQNNIFIDMVNNYMSGFLISQYENKFMTVDNEDWAFLTSVKVI